ncbi:UNVERIFIED_CONTAM: hypothetical protein K2H54_060045 [Gekko kuhli]
MSDSTSDEPDESGSGTCPGDGSFWGGGSGIHHTKAGGLAGRCRSGQIALSVLNVSMHLTISDADLNTEAFDVYGSSGDRSTTSFSKQSQITQLLHHYFTHEEPAMLLVAKRVKKSRSRTNGTLPPVVLGEPAQGISKDKGQSSRSLEAGAFTGPSQGKGKREEGMRKGNHWREEILTWACNRNGQGEQRKTLNPATPKTNRQKKEQGRSWESGL